MNRVTLSILALILLAVVLLLSAGNRQSSPAGTRIWVADSLERVQQNSEPGNKREVDLSAARGETQSFQIIVRSDISITRISGIHFSDFSGATGNISAKHAVLYREQFVRVFPNSPFYGGENPPDPPGWYPDALIPFRDPATSKAPRAAALVPIPTELKAGENQPFWVDISVPRDAAPGVYRSEFSVLSDHGTLCGDVILHVWGFTLPLRPSLKTSFGLGNGDSGDVNIQDELLRNKLAPARVDVRREREFIDHAGLPITGLGYWSGANIATCSMQTPPPVPVLIEEVSKHQRDAVLYNYTADEIDRCANLTEPLRAWARNLHAAGVRSLVTMAPRADLLDDASSSRRSAVDIWVLLPVMFDQAGPALQAARRKGNEIWSYNGLAQEGYSPKWLLDYSPINFRIQPGFLSQSLGLTGLLYWRVDNWRSDPWRDVNNTGVFGNYNAPGEGMLVYPGAVAGLKGVAPSMRLKWLRDGVQDYEYVELLKNRGRGDWALERVRSIARDWKHWTHQPAQLEAIRLALGQELDRIGEHSR